MSRWVGCCTCVTTRSPMSCTGPLRPASAGASWVRSPALISQPIRGVEYVPVEQLAAYGFSTRFRDLVAQGFPGAGSYMGLKANIGL
jgi:hypothetical protein